MLRATFCVQNSESVFMKHSIRRS